MENKTELNDGDSLLAIAKDGEIIDFTFNISLSHAEFVKRSRGELPEDGWIGTLRKMDGRIVAFNSYTFYDNQLPAPAWVQDAAQAAFS